MSMAPQTDRLTGAPQTAEVRGPVSDTFREHRPEMKETKISFATTEFWAMLVGIAALIAVYNVSDDASLNLWRTCILATAIGVGYLLSRGLAKSGSRIERWNDDNPRR